MFKQPYLPFLSLSLPLLLFKSLDFLLLPGSYFTQTNSSKST